MNTQHEKELKELREKMEKSERFSKIVSFYADKIISEKITGEEDWLRYGERYKSISLSWGINRGFFRNGSERTITNYEGEYACYLWVIYINSCSLYDSTEEYGLQDIEKKTNIKFYDRLNSTFYCTDEEIESLLEHLNNWYLSAVKEHEKDTLQQKIKEAKDEVKRAIEKVEKLGENIFGKIVVWKNGEYLYKKNRVSFEEENDNDWLVTIDVKEEITESYHE